ncbi:MAG: fibrinogen-like YCDxxxxGGGW domain-containing protein [Polyangiaceae bacterium]
MARPRRTSTTFVVSWSLLALGAASMLVGCSILSGLDRLTGETSGAGGAVGLGGASDGGGPVTSAGGGGGGGAPEMAGGGGGGGEAVTPQTCDEVLAREPGATSGVYTVDPDGPGGEAPFAVRCDMTPMGGWTLVGQEVAGDEETLRFLGAEQGAPEDLVTGASAHLGPRFRGLYATVRITWGDPPEWIEIQPGAELFDNDENHEIPVTTFATSNQSLAGWVGSAGGAIVCRAAVAPDIRPGDTSWAIKPQDDDQDGCGCSSSGWSGRGAFYSGSSSCTSCGCWPGSFVGVKDHGEPKAGVTSWTTRLFIR